MATIPVTSEIFYLKHDTSLDPPIVFATKNAFRHIAAHWWNDLPDDIVTTHQVPEEVLSAAVVDNDSVVVFQWLNSLADIDDATRAHLIKILHQSAYNLSVDVVKLFLPPTLSSELLSDIINHVDSKGMNAIRYAIEGYSIQKGQKHHYLLVETMAHLCEQGGSSMITWEGRILKLFAEEKGCRIAVVLLDILENISTQQQRDFPHLEYTDIDSIHKTLLHWAVNTGRDEVISQIFFMHRKDKYEVFAKLLFENDPNSLVTFQQAPIYTAAEMGHVKTFEALINHNLIPLNVLLGQRQKCLITHPDNTCVELFIVPLSLILSASDCCSLIDSLIDHEIQFDDHLTSVDVHNTMLRSLPVEVLKFPNLESLNCSSNKLKGSLFSHLPDNCIPAVLNDLNISCNNLENIPAEIFYFPCLKTLNVSYNPLKSLPFRWWDTKTLETLNASYTQLSSITEDIDDESSSQEIGNGASMPILPIRSKANTGRRLKIAHKVRRTESVLKKLNVSNSNIEKLPAGLLAVIFPHLESLNVSGNIIKSCCAINAFPVSLEELDISDNMLQCEEEQLFYHSAYFAIKSSCMLHNDLSKLRVLKLSNNIDLKLVNIHDKENRDVFFPRLQKLSIANCGLKLVPQHLSKLQDLTDLDISRNKDLRFPREIYHLENLINFNYDDIEDPIVNDLNLFTSVREKQMYLRGDRAVRSPSIKLVFLGDKEVDLPGWLSNESLRDKDHVMADEYTWCFSKPKSGLVINFNVWNFIGQDEHSSVDLCFLTEKSLYVLSWEITTDKDNGIAKLKNWLLRIKDRVEDASVILVGCQNKAVNDNLKHKLTGQINRLYGNQKYYPSIVEVWFISKSKLHRDIKQIQNGLYETAGNLKISLGSKRFSQKLKDMKVPTSYYQFLGLISKKTMLIKRGEEMGPPVLTWKELVNMVGLNASGHSVFRDEKDVALSVKYMVDSGTIIHFDSPGLNNYYFIDPHWLYDVFNQVCTSPLLLVTNNRINNDNGKVSWSLIHRIFKDYKIPAKYYNPMFKLLCRFEIAIPMDSDTLLLPSFFKGIPDHELDIGANCTFPGSTQNASMCSTHSFGSLFPSFSNKTAFKSIILKFTGMCFRRLFLVHHIPANFWQRLISRFLVSAEHFYNIFVDNCVKGITIDKMANIGDVVINNNHCKWLYWRNGITLTFGSDVLLCINGLNQSNSNDTDVSKKGSHSITVDRIKDMKFLNGTEWVQYYQEGIDGFEVNVPEYLVESSIEMSGSRHYSCKLSSQIFSYILDTLSESCTELFKGLPDGGIYSQSCFHLTQLVVCPYCYGDKHGDDEPLPAIEDEVHATENLYELFDQTVKPIFTRTESVSSSGDAPRGFNIQVCILKAQKGGVICCPNHGPLNLMHLAPDVVFEDVTLNKVHATEVGQPVSKGAFGSIYKVKLASDADTDVALKCFINLMDQNRLVESALQDQLVEQKLQDFAMAYSDIRTELNKLSSTYHPNIVTFLGLCVISFSFLLEWAPKGNLFNIVKEYKLADVWICPDAVANTVHQVSTALAYLHSTKNIVHFDIKPDNILVFKYPQAGHFCFTKDTSFCCESCYSEGGGVLVKLADLGISAFLGPGGFQRKSSTPTYAAPEVLKYLGKELLTEKVDIYSFAISLYEIMTLRKLPPEGGGLEFSDNIKAGRRPVFLPEDPNYPLPLIECVRSCWAHQYNERPKAGQIQMYFELPNSLWFKDCYELPNVNISTVLVVDKIEDGTFKEMIWITTNCGDDYNLVCYTFGTQEDTYLAGIVNPRKRTTHPKLYAIGHPVKLKSRVKAMCHLGQLIWIVYNNGTLAVCDVNNHTIVKDVVLKDLCAHPVTILVADHSTGLIAIAYRNGVIAFLWANDVSLTEDIPVVYFYSFDIVSIGWNSFNLNAIETCTFLNERSQLWCSFDNGKMQIVRPPVSTSGETEIVKVVEIKEYCTDLPHDTSIVQLKCSPNQDHKSTVMYAVHDGGLAISCWSVDVDPKLYTIIKPSLGGTVTVLLPHKHTLFIGDNNGNVQKIDTNDILEGTYSFEKLHGSHKDKVDFIIALHGKMDSHGFLSGCGSAKNQYTRQTSMLKRLESVPCTLLMSIGVGYQELFTSNINKDTCFITWALCNI